MTRFRVRSATPSDAQQIADIYNHHVVIGGATFANKKVTVEEVESMLTDGGANDGNYHEGVYRDGWYVGLASDQTDASGNVESSGQCDESILGWASARAFSDRFGYRLSCETAIYLSPSGIGTGIANQLQHCIHQHCKDSGIHHAMAKIIASNERSLRFHYRHGYELVGVQKEIGRLEGQWLDVAILQRLFPLDSPDDSDVP